MAGVLASVATVAEARLVAELGVEVVDFKDPARGALGAWAPERLRAAVAAVRGPLTSATIGDLPLVPGPVRARVEAVAACGVDVVKIGLFPGELAATLRALAPLVAGGLRLAAVALADLGLDPALPPRLADAGFRVLVIDTAGKARGRLLDHVPFAHLAAMVAACRRAGLRVALAGSLRAEDVARLAPLDPDLFGFRGALCAGGRTGILSPARVRHILATVRREAPRRPDLSSLARHPRPKQAGDGHRRRCHLHRMGEGVGGLHQFGEAAGRPPQA